MEENSEDLKMKDLSGLDKLMGMDVMSELDEALPKFDFSKATSPADVINGLMAESPSQTETRRALNKARRDSYEDVERDDDLEEKERGFRGVGRRNDAWDMSDKDYL